MLGFTSGIYAGNDQPGYEVKGIVSDKKSGEMLPEAHIYLEQDGEVLYETVTKKDGSFSMKVTLDPMNIENIQIRVKKIGYKTEMISTLPGSDQVQVQLEPSRTIPIMIPKKSPTGQYIIVQNQLWPNDTDILAQGTRTGYVFGQGYFDYSPRY